MNLPVLASFLSLLESLARYYLIPDVHIFHDESKEFAHGYEWAFNIYRDADPDVELHLPNGRMVVFSFDSVKSMTMVRSHDCLLVQAADLLVSALASYAKCAARGETPPAWLSEALDLVIAAAVLPAFVEMGTSGDLLGSPSFLSNMLHNAPSLLGNVNQT